MTLLYYCEDCDIPESVIADHVEYTEKQQSVFLLKEQLILREQFYIPKNIFKLIRQNCWHIVDMFSDFDFHNCYDNVNQSNAFPQPNLIKPWPSTNHTPLKLPTGSGLRSLSGNEPKM